MLQDKETAMKPISEMDIYYKFGFVITEHEQQLCPRCRNILSAGPNYQPRYCDQCGQRITFDGIDWKEEKTLGYLSREEREKEAKTLGYPQREEAERRNQEQIGVMSNAVYK